MLVQRYMPESCDLKTKMFVCIEMADFILCINHIAFARQMLCVWGKGKGEELLFLKKMVQY